jgi:autotransporter-associated beta strand protein
VPQQLKTRMIFPALGLLVAAMLWAAPSASAVGPFTMTISSTAGDNNVTCAIEGCLPTADGATLSLATLESNLSAGNLTVGDGGQITIASSSIDGANTDNNNLTFNGPVSLGGDTDITNSGLVTFSSTVDGSGPGQNLTMNADTVFDAAVGSLTELGSLTVPGPATATLGGNVSITGAQSYGGAVNLASSDVTLTTGGSLTFDSTVNGPHNLTLSAGGTVSLDGDVGNSQSLASLVIPTAAAIDVAGTIGTSGTQEYEAPVSLTGAATFGSATGDITFDSTIDGAQDLSVSTQATSSFEGAIGGTTPLTSIVVPAAPGSIDLNGNVTTTGSQQYGHLTLGANVTFSSGSTVQFNQPVSGDQLTIAGGGIATLPPVSDSYSGTRVTGGSTLSFQPGSLTGTGDITLDDGTLEWSAFNGTNTDDVSSQLQIGTGGGTLDTNNNDVTFTHTVDGTGALTKTGQGTLELNASTGSSYNNQFVVDGGTLEVNSSATVSTPVIVNSGGELECQDGTITGTVTNQGGTTYGAPGQPTSVTATTAFRSAYVSFTPGPDNCNPVSYSATSGTLTWGPVASGPITATGLAGAQPYAFTVTATNALGSSTSAASNTITPTPFMPTAAIAAPVNNATYTQGQVVYSSYSCQEGSGGTGIATCSGPVASGVALDTHSLGLHTFAVTATSSDGDTGTATATYTVVASKSSTTKPPNKFTIRQLKGHPSGSIDVTLASLVGAGTVKVAEHPAGLRAFSADKTASSKATLKLTLAPSKQLKTWLKRHHSKLNVKVTVTYTPHGGKARTVTKPVKL